MSEARDRRRAVVTALRRMQDDMRAIEKHIGEIVPEIDKLDFRYGNPDDADRILEAGNKLAETEQELLDIAACI